MVAHCGGCGGKPAGEASRVRQHGDKDRGQSCVGHYVRIQMAQKKREQGGLVAKASGHVGIKLEQGPRVEWVAKLKRAGVQAIRLSIPSIL